MHAAHHRSCCMFVRLSLPLRTWTAEMEALSPATDMKGLHPSTNVRMWADINCLPDLLCSMHTQVLLLGHGGQTVYMGPPGVAVLYFQRGLGFSFPPRENPADALMDIIGGKMAREGDARWVGGWVSRPRELSSSAEYCWAVGRTLL
jgi:hypothetical protein